MTTDLRHGFDNSRLDRIGGWMQRYVDERKFPGSALLVMRGGHEVYFNTCGLRNVEDGLPFTRDTIVRLYSMTKPVTSVALMMLVERGLLHLDAPVSDFIPSFNDMQALVDGAERLDQVEQAPCPTIHQLLTHTSGLSYPFNPGLLPQEMERLDLLFKADQGKLAAMTDKVATLPLAFQPGTRWEYSVSIDVIGRVVEVISDQTLDQFFASEILGPLGMTETAFKVPDGVGDRFASLYTPLAGDAMALNAAQEGGETLRLVDSADGSPFQSAQMFSGGGGLVGTIDDYARFTEMLSRGGEANGHRFLSPGTLEFMMRNHLPGDIASMGPQSFAEQPMEGTGFGIGGSVLLDPGRARNPGSVGDFSWGGMASTFFWIDRQRDLSVIFLTQLAPSSSYPARPQLKAMVQAALVE